MLLLTAGVSYTYREWITNQLSALVGKPAVKTILEKSGSSRKGKLVSPSPDEEALILQKAHQLGSPQKMKSKKATKKGSKKSMSKKMVRR